MSARDLADYAVQFLLALPLVLVMSIAFGGLGLSFGVPLLVHHDSQWKRVVNGIAIGVLASTTGLVAFLVEPSNSWFLAAGLDVTVALFTAMMARPYRIVGRNQPQVIQKLHQVWLGALAFTGFAGLSIWLVARSEASCLPEVFQSLPDGACAESTAALGGQRLCVPGADMACSRDDQVGATTCAVRVAGCVVECRRSGPRSGVLPSSRSLPGRTGRCRGSVSAHRLGPANARSGCLSVSGVPTTAGERGAADAHEQQDHARRE